MERKDPDVALRQRRRACAARTKWRRWRRGKTTKWRAGKKTIKTPQKRFEITPNPNKRTIISPKCEGFVVNLGVLGLVLLSRCTRGASGRGALFPIRDGFSGFKKKMRPKFAVWV